MSNPNLFVKLASLTTESENNKAPTRRMIEIQIPALVRGMIG